MIAILHSDTYPDKERWLGHPCMPRRVFGPKEYLVNPLQLSKPQVTLRPLSTTSGGSVLVQDQPQSKIGTFKPSGATSNTCTLKSKNTEDISSSIFMSWFMTVSANLNTKVKCKALFACQEAASAVIAEEWCNVEEQTEVILMIALMPGGLSIVLRWLKSGLCIYAEVPPPVNLLTMKPQIDRTNWMVFKVAGISKNRH